MGPCVSSKTHVKSASNSNSKGLKNQVGYNPYSQGGPVQMNQGGGGFNPYGQVGNGQMIQGGGFNVVNPPCGINSNFNLGNVNQEVFSPGEIQYLRHKEAAAYRGEVAGGRAQIQLSLSLKTTNPNIISEIKGIIVRIFQSDVITNQFTLLGTTENLSMNDYSLAYSTFFFMMYYFEKNQTIKIELINTRVSNTAIMETLTTTLGKIMGSRTTSKELAFNYNNLCCTSLVISGMSVKEEAKNSLLNLTIYSDLTSQPYSDYFMVISTAGINNQRQKIWKSAEMSGKNLKLSSNCLTVHELCRGDNDKVLEIEIYAVNVGKIGGFQATMNQISDCMQRRQAFNVNTMAGTFAGTCRIEYSIEKVARFIEMIENGLQISLLIGIDYTASNGPPDVINSKHYIFGYEPNGYEQAITNVGRIVTVYDYDQMFPVLGFGGIVPNTTTVNHCFSVNLQQDPNVSGLDGILAAYRNSLKFIKLDGPTYFAPLMSNIVQTIKLNEMKSQGSVYYILVIITDGIIHDLLDTKDIIVEAAYLPFSVIIIGIGDENFEEMVELDGDSVPLTNRKGERIVRDIVQFVSYNDFKSNPIQLAEEVLFEIPGQVEQYFRKYKNFRALN